MIATLLLAESWHYHPSIARSLAWLGLALGLLIILGRPREREATPLLGILVIIAILSLFLAIYFAQ